VQADRPRSIAHHRDRDGRGPISRRKSRHGGRAMAPDQLYNFVEAASWQRDMAGVKFGT
jgi:hypothetical protein